MSSGVLDPNVLIFVQKSPVFPRASASLHRGLRALVSRLRAAILFVYIENRSQSLTAQKERDLRDRVKFFRV